MTSSFYERLIMEIIELTDALAAGLLPNSNGQPLPELFAAVN